MHVVVAADFCTSLVWSAYCARCTYSGAQTSTHTHRQRNRRFVLPLVCFDIFKRTLSALTDQKLAKKKKCEAGHE